MSSYPPFSLSIGAPKNSPTKVPPQTWDYDPTTRTLSYRNYERDEHNSEIEVQVFERLVIGENVRGKTVEGGDIWLGELLAFAVNERGVKVPLGLVPQRRN